jgi:membrane associated rhomboid family serine protease
MWAHLLPSRERVWQHTLDDAHRLASGLWTDDYVDATHRGFLLALLAAHALVYLAWNAPFTDWTHRKWMWEHFGWCTIDTRIVLDANLGQTTTRTKNKPWTWVTHQVSHYSLTHLLLNSTALAWLVFAIRAPTLVAMSTWQLACVYLTGGVVAALTQRAYTTLRIARIERANCGELRIARAGRLAAFGEHSWPDTDEIKLTSEALALREMSLVGASGAVSTLMAISLLDGAIASRPISWFRMLSAPFTTFGMALGAEASLLALTALATRRFPSLKYIIPNVAFPAHIGGMVFGACVYVAIGAASGTAAAGGAEDDVRSPNWA